MTPEQSSLVEKAGESLQAAALLAEKGFYDFAVSRAYYTMFYCAEALVLELGLAFSKHSAVISSFGERLVKTGRVDSQYHRYLIEGQDSRNVGDYDLHSSVTADDADEQIVRAEKLLELANNMIGSG